MKKVAVIDYGMGNLMSVWRAWQHVGADAKIISSPTEMDSADVLVFPGQGCITDTIKLLKQCATNSYRLDKVNLLPINLAITSSLNCIRSFENEE